MVEQLTTAIQEALLALLCYDGGPRGAKLVRTLVKPEAFDVYYRDIAKAAEKHFEKYSKVPGDHTLDLVEAIKAKTPDAAEIFDRIFQSLQTTKDSIQPEYIISQASEFAEVQRMKQGASTLIGCLETGDLTGAKAAIQTCSKQTMDLFSPGLKLQDTEKSLAFLEEELEAFPTGIKELDKLNLGPARSRLHLFFALYKKGKSWWLILLFKTAIQHGLKVVYISLELSEPEVAQRLIQALFAVSKRSDEIKRVKFEVNEFGHFLSMEQVKVKGRPTFKDRGIRSHLVGKIDWLKKKPDIWIKRFPTGSLTMQELKAYLDGLEGSQGFIPDLVLVDYPDLMKYDPRYKTEAIGRIYEELRGLAVERNFAVATVTQSNREGESVKVIRGKQMGADFSKLQTADVILSYSQTDAEHSLGLARLFVVGGRTEVDRFTVLISQAYQIGQFCMDSARMIRTDGYWSEVDGKGEGDGEEE